MSVGGPECAPSPTPAAEDHDPDTEAEAATVDSEDEPDVDPIHDIIDYLVRCARGAFPIARVGETEPSAAHNTSLAYDLYRRSVHDFLARFGKHLALSHLEYFERAAPPEDVRRRIEELRRYHSPDGTRRRIKNRRYQALQKLRDEGDYFSEREMMYRNPLLYEQLVGQFLTDEEIAERDEVDSEQLTFVNMILDTVDRNEMRQTRNEQQLSEKMETAAISDETPSVPEPSRPKPSKSVTTHWGEFEGSSSEVNPAPRWGDFEKPDPTPLFQPETRQQSMITVPERDLLRREFLHEMYGSFLEGYDRDFDYSSVDDNEQFDDLQAIDRDKEEEYFDSEPVENDNLEQTMRLSHEYRRMSAGSAEDELDVFMDRLNKRNVEII